MFASHYDMQASLPQWRVTTSKNNENRIYSIAIQRNIGRNESCGPMGGRFHCHLLWKYWNKKLICWKVFSRVGYEGNGRVGEEQASSD